MYTVKHRTLGSTLVSRRSILGGLAAAGLGPWKVAGAAETLIVNGYGGEFGDILKATVITPFEKKFGVSVTYDDTGTSSTNYTKIRATGGAPGFDKRLAFAFLNFRLEPEIQRAFCLEYFASPGRMDITDWPEDYAALQLTRRQDAGRQLPRRRLVGATAARLDAAMAGSHGLLINSAK